MRAVADTASPPNVGKYANEDEALSVLVDRLVTGLDPQAVWLFGSRGRGDNRPDSDFDLLVVAKPGADWGSNDYQLVYRVTTGTGIGRDIVPISADDFAEAAQRHTTLVAIAVAEGRKLYEALR